jgi:hypothetical protein
MSTTEFLQQMKVRCQAKAVEMAKIELSEWDATHEAELQ